MYNNKLVKSPTDIAPLLTSVPPTNHQFYCKYLYHGTHAPYANNANNVTFPLHPVLPKKIPLATASLRSSLGIALSIAF